MSSSFLSLPIDIHLQISSYLTSIDNQNVSQCSYMIRYIYQKQSWKTCYIKIPDNETASLSVTQKYRVIPIEVLQNPNRFKIWFRPQFIKSIYFDTFQEDPSISNSFESSLKVSTIEPFVLLKSVYFREITLEDAKRLFQSDTLNFFDHSKISYNVIVEESFRGFDAIFGNVNQASFKHISLWKEQIFSEVLLSMTNLTRLSATHSSMGFLKVVINSLKNVTLPSLLDFTFEIDVTCEDDRILCSYSFEDLGLIKSYSFIKQLKIFQLNIEKNTFEDDPDENYLQYYISEGTIYSSDDVPANPVPLPFITHLNIKQPDELGDFPPLADLDILSKIFELPSLYQCFMKQIYRWSGLMGLNNINNPESFFTGISCLHLQLESSLDRDNYQFDSFSFKSLSVFKYMVNLKTLNITIGGPSSSKPDLYVRSLTGLQSTTEGSIFAQICKIFLNVQNEFTPEKLFSSSQTLLELICDEFPFIAATSQTSSEVCCGNFDISIDNEKPQNYESKINDNQDLIEANIRGFFIYWLHGLIESPEESLKNFSVEYHKLPYYLFDATTAPDTSEKTQNYIKLGMKGGNKNNRTYFLFQELVEFFFNIGFCECLFLYFPYLKNLEFLQISFCGDVIPSPRLAHFIRTSKSMKQALIHVKVQNDSLLTHILDSHPGESCQQILKSDNNCNLKKNDDTYLRDKRQISDMGTLSNTCEKQIYTHFGKITEPFDADSINTSIFPRAPENCKREIFWSGTIGKILKDSKNRVDPTIINNFSSDALVFYSLNKASGGFNNTLNIAELLGIEKFMNEELIQQILNELYFYFENRDVFEGWF